MKKSQQIKEYVVALGGPIMVAGVAVVGFYLGRKFTLGNIDFGLKRMKLMNSELGNIIMESNNKLIGK